MVEERRSARRARMSGVRIRYEDATGEEVEADGVDLARGGVFVRTARPVAVGKRLALEIQVIGEEGPWSALGRVVWVRERGEGVERPPGMGVKLIDIEDAVANIIDRLVETREHTAPGVGRPAQPAPVLAVAPPRERTILGVGLTPEELTPPPAREATIPIDLVAKKRDSLPDGASPAPSRPPRTAASTSRPPAAAATRLRSAAATAPS